MPKTSEMRESKFIKQDDIGRGLLLTIQGCKKYNVAAEGADPEFKWCLTFAEIAKPLVLNATNIQLIENITGSDDTDNWIGKQIVLYVDPTVTFGGKLVGGVRVRRPKPGTNGASKPVQAGPPPLPPMRVPAPAQPQPGEELGESEFDDSVPF